QALAAGESWRLEELKLRTGKTVSVSTAPVRGQDGAVAGSLLAIEDVSLARYMNEFVVENAKVSTVAQLAVGVAHEMNNPLFAIQNYLGVIRGRVNDAEIEDRIARIEREVTRISDIVSSLLSFSRVASAPRNLVDMREIIENAVILLQHAFREKSVTVDLELPPTPLSMHGDENRLTQVVLNLASNAVDAVLSGGAVRIRACGKDAACVEMEIIDDGCGIPDDVSQRVFEPFFTTKLSKRNTGLGLSICRNIIEEHGGTIQFKSRPGSGTVFTVRIPTAGT
ncbi:MAG TPA: HAMP domain-containing sensor histidine kinase, partial [Spirochaetia bacterium]|nr:HAMP domain-containing sensor histidine kinase [Spirochaetia bacterium]